MLLPLCRPYPLIPDRHPAGTLEDQPDHRYDCVKATHMSQPPGIVYRFGPFRYSSAQRLLYRDDVLVPLMPKAADTLQALLERRGQVVGKAELMKAVWPDCVVEDVGLARNISLLRKALGDDAEGYIETIPKRGYRFTADVDDTGLVLGRVDELHRDAYRHSGGSQRRTLG